MFAPSITSVSIFEFWFKRIVLQLSFYRSDLIWFYSRECAHETGMLLVWPSILMLWLFLMIFIVLPSVHSLLFWFWVFLNTLLFLFLLLLLLFLYLFLFWLCFTRLRLWLLLFWTLLFLLFRNNCLFRFFYWLRAFTMLWMKWSLGWFFRWCFFSNHWWFLCRFCWFSIIHFNIL